MAQAPRDGNYVTALLGTSNADGSTTIPVYADSSTNRLLVAATFSGVDIFALSNHDALAVAVVDGSGDQITSFGGGTQYTEADTDTTITGTAMMMEGSSDTLYPAQGDSTNGLLVNLGANNDVTVSGTVTANLSATDNAVLDAIQAAVEGTVTVDNAGTFAVQVDGAALTALQLIDDPVITDDSAFTPATSKVMMAGFEFDDTTPDSVDEGDAGAARMSARREIYVQLRDAAGNERGANVDQYGNLGAIVSGNVSHDAVDSGDPVKIGGKAQTAPPTAVAANDRVNAAFDTWGRQISIAGLREMKGSQMTTITSSTSETTVVTADVTYKLDVYGIIITNTSATDTEVTFKDSTAGTSRFQISAPANDTRGFMVPLDAAHIQTTANNNWTATCADSVASIVITVLYVKNL